jgi:hypothetical protein
MATTRELSEGTTRNTNNVPGYTGHMAQSVWVVCVCVCVCV